MPAAPVETGLRNKVCTYPVQEVRLPNTWKLRSFHPIVRPNGR